MMQAAGGIQAFSCAGRFHGIISPFNVVHDSLALIGLASSTAIKATL